MTDDKNIIDEVEQEAIYKRIQDAKVDIDLKIESLIEAKKYNREKEIPHTDRLIDELRKMKKKLKEAVLEDYQELSRKAVAWLDRVQPSSYIYEVSYQLMYYVIFRLFVGTLFPAFGSMYDIALPAIMQVIGELNVRGMGQYVRVVSKGSSKNSVIYQISNAILVLISIYGVLTYGQLGGYSKSWIITALVVYTYVLNNVLPEYMASIMKGLQGVLFGEDGDYEDVMEETQVKYYYGWKRVYQPLIVIFSMIGIGFLLGFSVINMIDTNISQSVMRDLQAFNPNII